MASNSTYLLSHSSGGQSAEWAGCILCLGFSNTEMKVSEHQLCFPLGLRISVQACSHYSQECRSLQMWQWGYHLFSCCQRERSTLTPDRPPHSFPQSLQASSITLISSCPTWPWPCVSATSQRQLKLAPHACWAKAVSLNYSPWSFSRSLRFGYCRVCSFVRDED